MARFVRYVVILLDLQPAAMFLSLAMSVHSLCAVPVMSTRGKMVTNHVLSASLDIRGTKVSLFGRFCWCPISSHGRSQHGLRFTGSPRVDGDDDEDEVDDLENEFNYAQGTSAARQQWQGEDPDLSSSSRHESRHPIPLLTNGQPVCN